MPLTKQLIPTLRILIHIRILKTPIKRSTIRQRHIMLNTEIKPNAIQTIDRIIEISLARILIILKRNKIRHLQIQATITTTNDITARNLRIIGNLLTAINTN